MRRLTMEYMSDGLCAQLNSINVAVQARLIPTITQEMLAEALIRPEDMETCRRAAILLASQHASFRNVVTHCRGAAVLGFYLRTPPIALFPDYVTSSTLRVGALGAEIEQFIDDALGLRDGFIKAKKLVHYLETYTPRAAVTHFPALRSLARHAGYAEQFPPGRAASIKALPQEGRSLVGPATTFINTASLICEAPDPPGKNVKVTLT